MTTETMTADQTAEQEDSRTRALRTAKANAARKPGPVSSGRRGGKPQPVETPKPAAKAEPKPAAAPKVETPTLTPEQRLAARPVFRIVLTSDDGGQVLVMWNKEFRHPANAREFAAHLREQVACEDTATIRITKDGALWCDAPTLAEFKAK